MTMVHHPRVQLSSATSSSLWPIAILLLLSTSTVTTAFYTPHHYLLYTNIMSSSSTKIQQSSTSSTNNEMVQTEELLSTIIHAATYGSHTISSLSDEARNGHIQFKEEGDARSALTGKKIAVCISCVLSVGMCSIYLVCMITIA